MESKHIDSMPYRMKFYDFTANVKDVKFTSNNSCIILRNLLWDKIMPQIIDGKEHSIVLETVCVELVQLYDNTNKVTIKKNFTKHKNQALAVIRKISRFDAKGNAKPSKKK